MSQGKFSNPRPYREEEREIEKSYRELTRQQSHRSYPHTVTPEDIARAQEPLPEETELLDMLGTEGDALDLDVPEAESAAEAEDRQIEETFQKITGKPVPPKSVPQKAPRPKFSIAPTFDEIPEEPVSTPERPQNKRRQWLDDALEFYNENGKLVLSALCAVSLTIIVFVILLFVRSSKDPYGAHILPNVYIGDINLGGMTKKEATALLDTSLGDVYASTDMVIDLSGTKLVITPKDSGASFDTHGAVEEAYAYGRTGDPEQREAALEAAKTQPHSIEILPYLNLKEDNIRKFLTEKSGNAKNTLVQSTYGLEGADPQLAADKFDKSALPQTLVITIGQPGVGFDPEDVYQQLLEAYKSLTFQIQVENVETLRDPDPIDLEKIYKEFYIAPVNATMDAVGSYGYEFDKEAAKQLLENAQFGQEIRIPMVFVAPEITDSNAFFRDTLGEYQTRASGSDDRLTNIRIACDALNGRVLAPGESLSFGNAVGQLSSSRGYKKAPEDIGTASIMGGGVTQVSSTLYCAALLSDLENANRRCLSQIPSFIESGFDADIDLTIKNPLPYPVRIDAKLSGGYVRITIVGTEQRDYYRRLGSETVRTIKAGEKYEEFPYDNSDGYADGDVIQEGRNGYEVKTYSVRYDRSNDKRITSDYVATSTYPAVDFIYAAVEEPPEETAPPIVETEPPTTAPPTETQPPVTETTAPPESATEATLPADTEEAIPNSENSEAA